MLGPQDSRPQAIKALEWVAAGHGDVDIAALLTRRAALPARPVPAPPPSPGTDAGTDFAWTPCAPAEAERRRYRVAFPARTDNPAKEQAHLVGRGFDLEHAAPGATLEAVVSASERDALTRQGYAVETVRDYFATRPETGAAK